MSQKKNELSSDEEEITYEAGDIQSLSLRLQKRLASRAGSSRNTIKTFLDSTSSRVIDNLYRMFKTYSRDKKKADRIITNMLRLTLKAGVLYRHGAFDKKEMSALVSFHESFHSLIENLVAMEKEQRPLNVQHLQQLLQESRLQLRVALRRHVTEKTLSKLDFSMTQFSNGHFIQRIFTKNSDENQLFKQVAADLEDLLNHHLI
ncbi:hypothetical protein SNEBB_009984 [Seison nebaliae]|nr:hypothetical protein SNEBB_009984 [Seison nebaliae]